MKMIIAIAIVMLSVAGTGVSVAANERDDAVRVGAMLHTHGIWGDQNSYGADKP